MKKILVPIDFSDQTQLLCDYALAFTEEGSNIKLFHTFYDKIILPDSTFPETVEMNTIYNQEWIVGLMHNAEEKLAKVKFDLERSIERKGKGSRTISTKVTGGDIELEIRDACQEYQPDLVVMGCRGSGKSQRSWGRITTFIVNHVNVPVLLIPDITEFAGMINTMIAVDLSNENALMIEKVVTLLAPFHPNFHCVHFLLHEKNRDVELGRLNKLKEEAIDVESPSVINFEMIEVEYENQHSIDMFVKERGITLIAFQPHQRSWFYSVFSGNITKRNFFSTNVPLLAIPFNE